MDVKERSLMFSETMVIAKVEIILTTADGITNKFVLNVLNPSLRREIVRYDAGGIEGIPESIPLEEHFGQYESIILKIDQWLRTDMIYRGQRS